MNRPEIRTDEHRSIDTPCNDDEFVNKIVCASSSSKTCVLRYTYMMKYREKIGMNVVYYKKLL